MAPTKYDIEVQKAKRLALLHYLNIPIPHPYSDVFKALDVFYDCHERIEIPYKNEHLVLCGLDKNSDILFVLNRTDPGDNLINTDDYVTIIHTDKGREILKQALGSYKFEDPEYGEICNMVATARRIVENRNGLKYKYSTYYSSDAGYIKGLKKECLKFLKLRNLALKGTIPNF